MEFFMLVIVLTIVFLSTCIAIVVLTDADILTFLAVQFGRAPADEFSGKVIWITGASSGIGEALAKEIAAAPNVKLVLSARRKAELDQVKSACLKLNPSLKSKDVLILPFDMVDIPGHDRAFDQVISEMEKLDILVCNAGRSQRARWHKTELAVDRDLFELNVFSVVNLSRKAVNYFLKQGGGQIVVTSSLAGIVGAPFSGTYTGSKHAIQGYFKSLRNEVSNRNITVTLLCPGPTVSSMLGPCATEKAGEALGEQVSPTDRRMTAERCAYLCSVAIANKLEESWQAIFPIITIAYVYTYMPYVSAKVSAFLAEKNAFMKLRDGRDKSTVKED